MEGCLCVRVVQVERCSHCLLVLGAVETALTINNCDSITVVTACRRLHVRWEMWEGVRRGVWKMWSRECVCVWDEEGEDVSLGRGGWGVFMEVQLHSQASPRCYL